MVSFEWVDQPSVHHAKEGVKTVAELRMKFYDTELCVLRGVENACLLAERFVQSQPRQVDWINIKVARRQQAWSGGGEQDVSQFTLLADEGFDADALCRQIYLLYRPHISNRVYRNAEACNFIAKELLDFAEVENAS